MDPGESLNKALLGGADPIYTISESDAAHRVDLKVLPTDAKWISMYKTFQQLIETPQNTIGQILAQFFTEHESRLIVPSDIPVWKELQIDNTERYNALLSNRFAGETPDISFKLTLLYFGFPIEPLEFPLERLGEFMEANEPEAPVFAVPPPLHFLTAHKQRHWGKEDLQKPEDPILPLPVVPPERVGRDGFLNDKTVPRLRGGGGDDDRDDHEGDDGESNQSINPDDVTSEDEEESESGSESEISNFDEDLDYIPRVEPAIDPCSENWLNLYGFQGVVPFVPGNWKSFATAVRHLLSVGPSDKKSFSLVHYDESSKELDEIHDCLPLEKDCASMEYVVGKVDEEISQFSKVNSSFFVKLRTENAPTHWEPKAGQLNGRVAQVRRVPITGNQTPHNASISRCYISLPTVNHEVIKVQDAYQWSANQYDSYMRTALEVLVGVPANGYQHAFYQIHKVNSHTREPTAAYGLLGIRSSEVKSLLPSPERRTMELKQRLLAYNEVAFVLPGLYASDMETSVKENGSNGYANAINIIRKMINVLFSGNADRLKHVRLLDGTEILGNHINRDQGYYYSIPMRDNILSRSITPVDDYLRRLVSADRRVVLLYPEWQIETCISIQSKEDPTKEHYSPMPSINSSLKEFRVSVSELLENAGFGEDQVKKTAQGDICISIQPRLGDKGEPDQRNPKAELPCYVIRSSATDNDWFSIRARIPTVLARINILDEEPASWISYAAPSNPWGPRYGHVAIERKMLARQQQTTKPPAELEDVKKYTPKVPLEETMVPSKPKDRVNRPRNAHVRPAIEDMRTGRDVKERQKAWSIQPSIFDNSKFRAWPGNASIRVPLNAPPTEPFLKPSRRIASVSKAVLTPTEQEELQKAIWSLRNIALKRTAQCPYTDCTFAYRLDEEEAISKHLKLRHSSRNCQYCDEELYEHWSPAKRLRHMREKHRNNLLESLGLDKLTIAHHEGSEKFSIPLMRVSKRPDNGEMAMVSGEKIEKNRKAEHTSKNPKQGFCDRCGRNRATYSTQEERKYHNRNCRPGYLPGPKQEFCTVCGNFASLNCGHDANNPEGRHCCLCGYDMTDSLKRERERHKANCKGYGPESGRFCIYCGIQFVAYCTQEDWNHNLDHMIQCYNQQPPEAVSKLPLPHADAFRQQQNKLRASINDVRAGAVNPEEGRQQTEVKKMEREGRVMKENDNTIDHRDSDATTRKRSEPKLPSLSARKPSIRLLPAKDRAPPKGTKPPNVLDGHSKPPEAPSARKPAKRKSVVVEPPEEESISEPGFDSDSESESEDEYEDGDEYQDEGEQEVVNGPRTDRARKRHKSESAENIAREDDEGDDEEVDDSKSDAEYEAQNSGSGDDELAEESRPLKKKVHRRNKSPDWNRLLGPGDPNFDPPADHYCSRCFRKAPKKHNRAKSPLGRKQEIEHHFDPARCCRIRRGIGSAEDLPNRSGWIPSDLFPKPISTLRKRFTEKYPEYERTLYPLHASNSNGSYWRSDPNNEENKAWWSIPWPPFRGRGPFADGWNAPDAPLDARDPRANRPMFKLRAAPDPTYRQRKSEGKDEEEDDEVEPNPQQRGRKRKRPKTKATTTSMSLADKMTRLESRPAATKSVSAAPKPLEQSSGATGMSQRSPKKGPSPRKRAKTDNVEQAG